MSYMPESITDLAARAGAPPEGVSLTTWMIAEIPPGQLTQAAHRVVPSYEDLLRDKQEGGDLLQFITETPLPEKALGEEILNKQQQLSGPRRRLATVACSLALFAGSAGFMENTMHNIDQNLKRDNPKSKLNTNALHLESDMLVGVPAGFTGGFIAYMTSLGLSKRLAVRPAKKIVRQAQQEQL